MKTIKKSFVFIPLLITVLLIVIGVAVLIAGQTNEIKIYTSGEFTRFLKKDAGEASKKAVLYADITLKETFELSKLCCELDGNGHTITVKDTGAPCLFDTVTETGAVRNLMLAGKIGGTDSMVTAGITVKNFGSIENCLIKADFSSGGFVSGICHTNNGKVANCFVRSNGMFGKELGYVWNPICAENYGSVKHCYHSDASNDGDGTVGAYIKGEEMKSENLFGTLNGYAENNPELVGWQTDENGALSLKPESGSQSASVFSGGNGVFFTCIIILIIAVPILTIVYVDKQKKRVIYNKIGEGE